MYGVSRTKTIDLAEVCSHESWSLEGGHGHGARDSLLPSPKRGGGGGNVLHVVATLLIDKIR